MFWNERARDVSLLSLLTLFLYPLSFLRILWNTISRSFHWYSITFSYYSSLSILSLLISRHYFQFSLTISNWSSSYLSLIGGIFSLCARISDSSERGASVCLLVPSLYPSPYYFSLHLPSVFFSPLQIRLYFSYKKYSNLEIATTLN